MENLKNILTKEPWKKYHPGAPGTPLSFDAITQADFIRQYHPYSHQIFDRSVYPDIYREIEEPVYNEAGEKTELTRRNFYVERVPRYAFAFQQIIALKQLIHATGNDTQFDLDGQTGKYKDVFGTFRTGWSQDNLEYVWYKFVESIKRTGDGAIVGYMSGGKFGARSLSYFDGSELYPQYDPLTGEMTLFARKYSAYDWTGGKVADFVEVWDKTHLYRYRRGYDKGKTFKEKIGSFFGLDGFELIEAPISHRFPFLPVVYYRDSVGACWSPGQSGCDGYDMAFSMLAQNNKAYGLPILGLKTENADSTSFEHDLDGTVKTILLGPEDDAKLLQANSASENFMKELDTNYKMIYESCFAVTPPTLKSGDLPAAALKILYSPAYEKAMADSQDLQPALNKFVEMAQYGIGIQYQQSIDMMNMPIKAWIKPYVHVNESAVMADLAIGVQNGFISKETATERASFYTSLNEWERISAETKAAQEADLLYQFEQSRFNNQNQQTEE